MTRSRLLRAAGVALLALGAPACSLIGLQNFEVPACNADSDCNALNDLEGIDSATACELYQCVEGSDSGGCVFRMRDDDEDAHVSIACGGDDCDDTDPLAYPGAPVVSQPIVDPASTPEWLRWGGASPDGSIAVTYGVGTNAAAFDTLAAGLMSAAPTEMGGATDAMGDFGGTSVAIELGCLNTGLNTIPFPDRPIMDVPGRCTTHEECQDGSFCNGWEYCQPESPAADDNGCRTADDVDPCGDNQCDEAAQACLIVSSQPNCQIAEVASAYIREDDWFAAEISRNGCAVGRLVVGWMSTADPLLENGEPGANVLLRGGQGRAPSFTGIDLGGSPLCTGNKRGDGEPRGAAAVAIGNLPADPDSGRLRPQALVAWQAAPACRHIGTCSDEVGGTGAVGVEVIGAWFEQRPGMNPARWVSVTGSGLTHPLDTATTGTASPEVLGIDTADGNDGYLVLYGAQAGGINARFVPAFSDPPYAETTEGPGVLQVAPYATLLSTSATARSQTRVTPPIADLGGDTALPAGGGASATVDHVRGAVGPVDGASASLLLAWEEGGAVWVTTATLDASAGSISADTPTQVSAGGAASRPEVAWVDAGLCGPECGGWAVTWVEDGQGRLMRFGDDGGALDAAPFSLGASASYVRAFESGGAVRVAWHSPDDGALVVSNGQCPPVE